MSLRISGIIIFHAIERKLYFYAKCKNHTCTSLFYTHACMRRIKIKYIAFPFKESIEEYKKEMVISMYMYSEHGNSFI